MEQTDSVLQASQVLSDEFSRTKLDDDTKSNWVEQWVKMSPPKSGEPPQIVDSKAEESTERHGQFGK